jgi:hypothetical protein
VDLKNAAAVENEAAVSVTLTDHAQVSADIVDPADGRVVAHREAGMLAAGVRTIRFSADDYVSEWSAGRYRVVVRAHSTYAHGASSTVEVPIELAGAGGPVLPRRLTLHGNTPNPFNPSTTIRFSVPAGPNRPYSLRVYDVRGAFVRELAAGQVGGGTHEARWDGRDHRGESVSSGIYLYRLVVGDHHLTGKMALVK